jgi:hypothetical protein
MPVPSEAPSAALWLFASLALLLVALAGFGAGRWLERARQRQALREARAQGQLLAQLLDVWQWQTDRHHRLVRLQPPAGARAEAWAQGDWGGQPLWERFVADAGSLRAQLESMVALSDLAVRPVGAAQDGDWLLRGVPRFDADGQFEGYVGTARAGTAGAGATPSGRWEQRRTATGCCAARRAWCSKASRPSCSASRPPSATPSRTTCARRSAWSRALPAS